MSDSRQEAEFVERIVREVIRRLLERGVSVNSTLGSGLPGSTAEAGGTQELRLTDALITLETLRTRLTGVRRLTVRRKAVVTPAVRDELRQRQIELQRQD